MKGTLRARFRLLVIVQVLLIVASVALLAYTAVSTSHVAVPVVIGIAVLLQVLGLLHSVERHVDTLEDFFAAIHYEDLTRRYVTDDVDAELKAAFNRVIDRFREARAERDQQAGYLETVVRHVPVPLMAARADGSLRLANNPLKRMTGLPNLREIADFAALDPELPERLGRIEAGSQQMLQTRFRDRPVELRVAVAEIRLDGDAERIYSIENLSGELSARESSAWRNLIRVMTHEIVNTLTPVASLAETSVAMAARPDAREDLEEAVTTIARRSRGLMQFVERYRELMKVPTPEPEPVSVRDAFASVERLMADELDGVAVSIDVDPASLEVQADPVLLDQVLVNLLQNAVQALAGTPNPAVILRGRLEYGRTSMKVIDNGPGIADDVIEQVFVPFYTTRRDGSGIGLSLSRQIAMAHGGELVASSSADGTTMTLLL